MSSETINTETALSVHATPGSDIVVNGLDEMRARIAAIVADYQGVEIPRDYLAQAKKERAWLRSLKTSIDQRRKEVKQAYMAPVTAFEAVVKDLVGPLDEAAGLLDVQIKAFEEADKASKKQAIADHWHEFAGSIATAVDFELVFDAKWLNKTVGLQVALEGVEAAAARIARDVSTLEEMGLAHHEDALAEYHATLDLSAAVARSKRIEEQQERTRASEEQRAQDAAWAELQAKGPDPFTIAEAEMKQQKAAVVEVDYEDLRRDVTERATCAWSIEFEGTRDDASKVAAVLKELGFTGRVRRMS